MSLLLDILSGFFLLSGCFFLITGALGMLRLPDFFTRVHGAAVIDSLGTILIMVGLVLQSGWNMTLVKILLTFLFLMLTGPTAVHALAKSALYGGVLPDLADEEEEIDD